MRFLYLLAVAGLATALPTPHKSRDSYLDTEASPDGTRVTRDSSWDTEASPDGTRVTRDSSWDTEASPDGTRVTGK